MTIDAIIHGENASNIAEIQPGDFVLRTVQDALDLMVAPAIRGARRIVIPASCIAPEFFDLSTRIAGEILQKFVTYQVRLAIVGDFSDVKSTSLRDFIYECNQGDQFIFVPDTETALAKLSV